METRRNGEKGETDLGALMKKQEEEDYPGQSEALPVCDLKSGRAQSTVCRAMSLLSCL